MEGSHSKKWLFVCKMVFWLESIEREKNVYYHKKYVGLRRFKR